MLELRILHFEDLTVGMSETFSKTVSSSDVVGFAEVTGDRNPIHLSQHFAAKTPFGTRIAHGLYTASLISVAPVDEKRGLVQAPAPEGVGKRKGGPKPPFESEQPLSHMPLP